MKIFQICSSCTLLKIRDLTILIDFPLTNQFPKKSNLKEKKYLKNIPLTIPYISQRELEEIDVILITNEFGITGLPFITEYSSFKGVIYCTEPILLLGTMLMEEISQGVINSNSFPEILNENFNENFKENFNENFNENFKENFNENFKENFKENENIKRRKKNPKQNIIKDQNIENNLININFEQKKKYQNRVVYSLEDIEKSTTRITTVKFNQEISIYGILKIKAANSGYSLGSTNWILKTSTKKIVLMSEIFLDKSAQKQFSTPLSQSKQLKSSDVIILLSNNLVPIDYPQTENQDAIMIQNLQNNENTQEDDKKKENEKKSKSKKPKTKTKSKSKKKSKGKSKKKSKGKSKKKSKGKSKKKSKGKSKKKDQPNLQTPTTLAKETFPKTTLSNNISKLLDYSQKTLKRGGNVIIPFCSYGIFYDIINILTDFISDNPNIGNVTTYIVSPTSKKFLAYSNTIAEYLNENYSQQVFIPEPSFKFEKLIPRGKLVPITTLGGSYRKEAIVGTGNMQDVMRINPAKNSRVFTSSYQQQQQQTQDTQFISGKIEISNINAKIPILYTHKTQALKEPCVVFVSHPSLLFGDVVSLIEKWKANSKNCLISIDPNRNFEKSLLPFLPMNMESFNVPINKNANLTDFFNFITKINPSTLVIPKQIFKNNNEWIQKFLSQNQLKLEMVVFKHQKTKKISIKEEYEIGYIESRIENIGLNQAHEAKFGAFPTAMMVNVKNYKNSFEKVLLDPMSSDSRVKTQRSLFGIPSLQSIIEHLSLSMNIQGVSIHSENQIHTISFSQNDPIFSNSSLIFNEKNNQTQIICSNEVARQILKKAILKNVSSFGNHQEFY
ncbi:integrator complex subunit 9 [Anaeramoeba ignava]|uniref:Integrator complex subunit 9 n=1 Tax=Anaeramoeba ignava TaxID=1746090 RepID=A0A9Q0LNK8_ANAIG|nr:integrator complex subunit 9 [Anaeramoeba ignava]